MPRSRSALIAVPVCSIFALASHAALAQETPPSASANAGSIADIVVTAQKRAESLQKVPLAATALTGNALSQKGVNDIKDLVPLVPNLAMTTTFGPTNPQITIRGIGSGSFNQTAESTIALYLDEFVLNPQSSKLGQLFDLERIEVLRGPQGTLYGKNSTGGAINFVSRKPDGTTAANATGTVGTLGELAFEAGAQAPLAQDLSARIVLKHRHRGGFGENLATGRNIGRMNEWGGRLTLRYEHEGLDAVLKFFGDRARNDGNNQIANAINPATGAPIPGNANVITGYVRPTDIDVVNRAPQHSNVDNRGVTLNVSQDLGSLTLTSVSGYLFSKSDIIQDTDGSPFPLAQTNPYLSRSKEFSQELRLSSSTGGAFEWIAGVNYLHQTIRYDNTNNFNVFGLPFVGWAGKDETTSYAGFIDGTFHLNDRLSLVGGVRLTVDKKNYRERSTAISLVGPYNIPSTHRWTEPSYRAGLNFQANADTLMYLSYNHGYRSGAYDSGLKTSLDQFNPADPEFVDNYEGGLKTALFDGRLRLSTAIFYMIFKDQQLILPNSGGLCCALINAGKSKIYGLEMEGTGRISDNFDLNFSAAISRSKYIEFEAFNLDFAGASVANVPRYSARIAPEYRIPLGEGNLFVAPEFIFTGRSRISVKPDPFGLDIQRAYQLINGQLGYRAPEDRYSIFAFVKNATKKRFRTYSQSVGVYGLGLNIYNEPRQFGVTGSVRF